MHSISDKKLAGPPPKYETLDDVRKLHRMRFNSEHYLWVEQDPIRIIHPLLSLGQNDTEYYVTWSLKHGGTCVIVWENKHNFVGQWRSIQPDRRVLVDNSGANYTRHFYRTAIQVVPNQLYSYQIFCSFSKHSPSITSREHRFLAKSLSDTEKNYTIGFYGDLGLINGQSIPRLIRDVHQSRFDLIIHNGDFAYDLNTNKGQYADDFIKMIEPIAAVLPYQTSVGNHEIAGNFSEYEQRFSMLNRGPINRGAKNNFYYSFDVGPVHFIAISTEFYYFLEVSGVEPLSLQYKWLEQDLAQASSPSQRAKRPWIVVFGHRPMYCSSNDNDDCTKETNLLRRGLPFTGAFALEKLFYDFGVDMQLYSHEHQYERFLPIYDGLVYNGTSKPDQPYHNPLAPVHIISGSAGCQERLDPFMGKPAIGSLKRISDYGYSRLRATKCNIYIEQISDDKDGTIVDKFEISKDRLQNFPTASETTMTC